MPQGDQVEGNNDCLLSWCSGIVGIMCDCESRLDDTENNCNDYREGDDDDGDWSGDENNCFDEEDDCDNDDLVKGGGGDLVEGDGSDLVKGDGDDLVEGNGCNLV